VKTVTVTINQYEVGDVLDVTGVKWHTNAKKRSMSDAKKALVLAIQKLATGECTYKAFADNCKTVLIIPGEQGAVKYIGHMDISMMFED